VWRVFPTTAPQDAATTELVQRLRSDVLPAAEGSTGAEVLVTGFVAVTVDFADYLAGRLVLFFAVVLALSFLLLMVVFRSLLVPLKAVVMNLLSIGAAYGVLVAVFQWGWLKGLVGVEPAPIEPFIPMMLFAIVFGLSMDYEVFLLSRVREEWDRTGDARNSVADGLAVVNPADGAVQRVIPVNHPTGDGPVIPAVSGTMVIEQRGAAIAGFGPG
jgi:RND superfamily putative drug exporter